MPKTKKRESRIRWGLRKDLEGIFNLARQGAQRLINEETPADANPVHLLTDLKTLNLQIDNLEAEVMSLLRRVSKEPVKRAKKRKKG